MACGQRAKLGWRGWNVNDYRKNQRGKIILSSCLAVNDAVWARFCSNGQRIDADGHKPLPASSAFCPFRPRAHVKAELPNHLCAPETWKQAPQPSGRGAVIPSTVGLLEMAKVEKPSRIARTAVPFSQQIQGINMSPYPAVRLLPDYYATHKIPKRVDEPHSRSAFASAVAMHDTGKCVASFACTCYAYLAWSVDPAAQLPTLEGILRSNDAPRLVKDGVDAPVSALLRIEIASSHTCWVASRTHDPPFPTQGASSNPCRACIIL